MNSGVADWLVWHCEQPNWSSGLRRSHLRRSRLRGAVKELAGVCCYLSLFTTSETTAMELINNRLIRWRSKLSRVTVNWNLYLLWPRILSSGKFFILVQGYLKSKRRSNVPGDYFKLSNSRVGPGKSQMAAENRAESVELGRVPSLTPVINRGRFNIYVGGFKKREQVSPGWRFPRCSDEIKGHYLAGSRSTSLSHQKSTNCQIFSKLPQNTNSTLLILIQFKTDSYLLSLTSSDRYESSDMFFNHGPLILFSQTKTDLIRKPVQFWVGSRRWDSRKTIIKPKISWNIPAVQQRSAGKVANKHIFLASALCPAERAKFSVIKLLQKLFLNNRDMISKSHRRDPTQN